VFSSKLLELKEKRSLMKFIQNCSAASREEILKGVVPLDAYIFILKERECVFVSVW
jgi:RAB protein geranylgeranyltransferase component A